MWLAINNHFSDESWCIVLHFNICIPKDPAHEFADWYQGLLILHPLEVGLYSHSNPHCPTPRGLHKIIDIIDYVKVYVAYMIYDKIKQYRIELDNLLTVA